MSLQILCRSQGTGTSLSLPPTVLNTLNNDLDFKYAPGSLKREGYSGVNIKATVSGFNNFISNGGNHVILGFELAGQAGGNNPHCGPVYRNGENLWTHGMGFIIQRPGSFTTDIVAEKWNGTAAPVLSQVMRHNGGFSTSADKIHIDITASYEVVPINFKLWRRVSINLVEFMGANGAVFYTFSKPDYISETLQPLFLPTDEVRAAIGVIGPTFKPPQPSYSCTEPTTNTRPSNPLSVDEFIVTLV